MPVHTIVNLYIVIPYFYYLCFCSVTVILLHSGSFCHEKQIPRTCKHTRHVNITMSALVIEETANNKHYYTMLKTRVWIVSSRNVLKGCESEASDCPCKVGIAPLYSVHSLSYCSDCRLLFQIQEIVFRKMHCTHTNIWVELFWYSVVKRT